nr:hypothetical protein [Tanacetum cinerariifolium]
MKTFSATSVGLEIVRSASSRTIFVSLRVGVMKEFFISLRDFSNRFMRISSLSSRAAAICWRSKEFEWEEGRRGAFVFALTSVTLLLEYLTFDLLSMIDKHLRGILSKKFPPAAESSAS